MDKQFLEERFKRTKDGIYRPYQPLYGFWEDLEDVKDRNNFPQAYLITDNIFRVLSGLKFDSLLDVGAAEGFTAYRIRRLFGCRVECSDVSEEACKRAREIFNLKATPADIRNLPYKTNEFDVVLCTEVLEHVPEWGRGYEELYRVAKNAIIITVPHEPIEVIQKNRERNNGKSHINKFYLSDFDGLSHEVTAEKLFNNFLSYKLFYLPVRKKLVGGVRFLVWLDRLLIRFAREHKGMIFTILKNNIRCKPRKIKWIDIKIPYYYL